jgi:hypothetical protein
MRHRQKHHFGVLREALYATNDPGALGRVFVNVALGTKAKENEINSVSSVPPW